MKTNRYSFGFSILSICGAIIAIYILVKYEENLILGIAFNLADWIFSWSIAMLLVKTFDIFYGNRPTLKYLSLIAFLTPIATMFQPLVYRMKPIPEWFISLSRTFYFTECILLFLIAIKFLSSKASGLRASENNALVEEQLGPSLLGQGTSHVDTVIKSINYRANASQKAAFLSLIIIVIIVTVGGGASIGTAALDELKRVRQIEIERGKLLSLNEKLEKLTENNTTPSLDTAQAIVQFIKENYGNESKYEVVLQKIEKRSQNAITGWQDIVMRISIAVLSLFLVQVFFHIYRFNQQQSSHLWTKSEILELFKDSSEENLQEMRNTILSRMDSSPKFGKSPQSPIDLALELLNKAKNTSS